MVLRVFYFLARDLLFLWFTPRFNFRRAPRVVNGCFTSSPGTTFMFRRTPRMVYGCFTSSPGTTQNNRPDPPFVFFFLLNYFFYLTTTVDPYDHDSEHVLYAS